jgi:hypothetical protein
MRPAAAGVKNFSGYCSSGKSEAALSSRTLACASSHDRMDKDSRTYLSPKPVPHTRHTHRIVCACNRLILKSFKKWRRRELNCLGVRGLSKLQIPRSQDAQFAHRTHDRGTCQEREIKVLGVEN